MDEALIEPFAPERRWVARLVLDVQLIRLEEHKIYGFLQSTKRADLEKFRKLTQPPEF